MKMFSFAKALTLGTLVCLALPVACGDDDDSGSPMTPSAGSDAGGDANASGGGNGTPGTPDAGAGGAVGAQQLPPGLSATPSSTQCDGNACSSAKVAGGVVNVDPCCDSSGACGLNTGFLSLVGAHFAEACQVHDQPGEPSTTCGAASGLVVPFPSNGTTLMVTLDPFPGCCRPDGTCGVVIDKVTSAGGKVPIADFGLGCVDAAPFSGGVVKKCADAGAGGAGGAGGMSSTGEAGGAAGGAGGATAG